MKEQLPLKRIFIGLAASAVTSFMVTAAGSVNEALADSGCDPYIYAGMSQQSQSDTYAPVRALNHEEYDADAISVLSTNDNPEYGPDNKPVIETQTEKYSAAEWWKAELDDYDESLEQQALVTPAPQEQQPVADANAAQPASPDAPKEQSVINSSIPSSVLNVPPAQASRLPETLDPNTFYFVSYGYGHGVGLSQNGANLYATYADYDYVQILQHYYPGTTVMYTPGAESEVISVRGYSGSVLDIVSMVCNAEVGSSFDVEAIKAQAVAAYTYIKYCGGSTSGMAIKEHPDQKVIDAVRAVIGQAVYYNGSFALTQFYASSGGSTASCKDVFYEDIPYLRSVSSEFDAAYDSHYGEVTAISIDSLRNKLQNAYGITLSSDCSSWIQLIEGDGGYIADVNIDGQKTVDGYAFARSIGLKSGKFTVMYT
ncbi:MAG: SpoIID/LytB domain-containing protein [Oscillospiraceae bacterium]|nr:SpoIID/LytB domain-containing protein [Oscillospiraceae bacterium]